MDENTLVKQVEEYLNKRREDLVVDVDIDYSSQDRFKMRTIKRLKYIFDLYEKHHKFYNDFLIALRDYLLIFKTSIRLDEIIISPDNAFSINKDEYSGKYFASYQLPTYVNETFVKQVYLEGYHASRLIDKGYDLLTDPLVYSITGFSKFKTMNQKLAVYGALNTPDGYTTLVSLPTGGGKSLITQTLAYQSTGLTVAIVPTVSLALDQVRVAKEIIHTQNADEEIFHYSSGVDASPIINAIKNKTARLLFISPEALIKNQRFSDAIKTANQQRYLKNIIIDEAHIVVDWGASFRVDYQCLESWRRKLMVTNPGLRTLLLSATYERRCIDILKDFFATDDKWIEIRCDALRHEPRYMLIKAKSFTDKKRKMIELVEKLPHPMIIYVTRPSDAEEIKTYLSENGINNTRTFTGLTSSAKREQLIDEWVDDQFEIMIATSAFGVGVDKSDVRTVLHMYIPQNPNAYYQELGRGGRDKLPCLSVMCICPEDTTITFNRINKKVLTTEKIIGRWDSMYNSPLSIRVGNYTNINTSIKPKYNVVDEFDDAPVSDTDMNWNIYVLLLLRRYNMISIMEVLPQNDNYIFVVSINDDLLRTNDNALQQKIESIRTQEWDYYNEAFKQIKKAILQSGKSCWSEMFYETYDKVSEYCAGCDAHNEAIEGDFYEFSLKRPVTQPVKQLAMDQLALFGPAYEMVVYADEKQRMFLIEELQKKRLSVLITESDLKLNEGASASHSGNSLLVIDCSELRDLMSKSCYYYVSGLVAIVYSGEEGDVYNQLKMVIQYLSNKSFIRLIHIIKENVYFESLNKAFTDLIDGPVMPINVICSKEGGQYV